MKKTLHRFAISLALTTLGLIFIGGLVKTTDSGLAVPDWPLSYGQLMPPMIGGIFYEHGHRMVAAFVGFLTIILAVLFSRGEERPWVRKAAWGALALVIGQGLFGGMTVLLRLPPIVSIVHACLAQTFFCLVTAIAVWSSPYWRDAAPRVEPRGALPVHQLAATLFGASWVQLVLGAVVRHTGWGLIFHVTGAVIVTTLAFWSVRRVFRDHADHAPLKRIILGLVAVLLAQVALGIASYFILIHRFETIPPPFWALATVTAHVMIGALLLGLTVIFGLVAYRSRPSEGAPLRTRMKDYFELTKPGISFMAGITALAGYVLGSRGEVDAARLIHTCVGTLMAAAGAGILNMVIERDIDALMKRTRERPLPSGRMNAGEALFLGALCAFGSVVYLAWTVNLLTAFLAGLTLSVYLYIYTPLKKVTALCVTVGAVAGALPPVMGWTAAAGRLGIEALVLFGILFFWQFPHFLSLAWLYKDDYEQAGFHMLPDQKPDAPWTARMILGHSIALLAVSCAPTLLGFSGYVYLATALLLGGATAVTGALFFFERTRPQAKRLFLVSVMYIPLLVTVMVLDK